MPRTKKLPDIRPENIGGLFTDGIEYYVLERCDTEPKVEFKVFRSPTGDTIIGPISDFTGMRMIDTPRPIEDVKKPRADKGQTHQRRKKQTESNQLLKDLDRLAPTDSTGYTPRFCPEHNMALVLYPGDDGKGVWQCLQNDCGYQINDKGEHID